MVMLLPSFGAGVRSSGDWQGRRGHRGTGSAASSRHAPAGRFQEKVRRLNSPEPGQVVAQDFGTVEAEGVRMCFAECEGDASHLGDDLT